MLSANSLIEITVSLSPNRSNPKIRTAKVIKMASLFTSTASQFNYTLDQVQKEDFPQQMPLGSESVLDIILPQDNCKRGIPWNRGYLAMLANLLTHLSRNHSSFLYS